MGVPLISAAECIKALTSIGYQHVRTKGSHAGLVCPGRHTVIVVLNQNPIPPGTLRSILRQAGLSVDEFRALL